MCLAVRLIPEISRDDAPALIRRFCESLAGKGPTVGGGDEDRPGPTGIKREGVKTDRAHHGGADLAALHGPPM